MGPDRCPTSWFTHFGEFPRVTRHLETIMSVARHLETRDAPPTKAGTTTPRQHARGRLLQTRSPAVRSRDRNRNKSADGPSLRPANRILPTTSTNLFLFQKERRTPARRPQLASDGKSE